MGNFLGLNVNLGDWTSSMSTITDFLVWLLVLGIFAGLAYIVYWYMSFKYPVMIIQRTGGKNIVSFDKAKAFKDHKGVPKWQFLKMRRSIEVPPDNYVNVTDKGKKMVACYVSGEGTITWTEIKGEVSDSLVESFSSEERTLAINEFREAEGYRKKRWPELIGQLAMPLSLVLIISVFLLFLPGVITAISDMNSRTASVTDASERVLDRAADILEQAGCGDKRQYLTDNEGNSVAVVPPN